MTVTILETLQTNLGGSASGSLTVTTSLLPDDYLVLVASVGANAGAGAVTVSGLGTWTHYPSLSGLGSVGGVGAIIKTLTGVTGGGTISLTAGVYGQRVIVYVLRGLTYNDLDNYSIYDLPSGSTAITTTGVPYGPLIARDNSFILAVYRTSFGTATPAATGSTPSSGWTTDVNVVGTFDGLVVAHYIAATETWMAPLAKNTSNFSDERLMLLVFGTPSTSFEARTQTSYADVAAFNSATEGAVYGEYLEASTYGTADHATYATYFEVLAPYPSATVDFSGWGTPINLT